MEAMRIAAIIPVFNRPGAVIEALASVAAQTRRPDRIIVVDDGSTDDTADRIRRWRAGQPTDWPFTLIRQKNGGVAAARNRGAAEAKDCELLAFLDSDDLWPADYVERMTKAMTESGGAVPGAVPAVVAARYSVDLLNGRNAMRLYDQQGRLCAQRLFVTGPPGTSNMVMRRSCFDRIGGYEEERKCAEDYQLTLRLSLLGRLEPVKGEAVISRRGTAGAEIGESGQLSRRYDDRRYRLAQVLDRFIHEDGGAAVIEERVWRKRLGRVWYSAGRGLRRLGRYPEARDCFRRCVRYLPGHLRARWRLLWNGRK
ncbi:MAG: glycosyltransferase [Phycisphaerales bacterium]